MLILAPLMKITDAKRNDIQNGDATVFHTGPKRECTQLVYHDTLDIEKYKAKAQINAIRHGRKSNAQLIAAIEADCCVNPVLGLYLCGDTDRGSNRSLLSLLDLS